LYNRAAPLVDKPLSSMLPWRRDQSGIQNCACTASRFGAGRSDSHHGVHPQLHTAGDCGVQARSL